MVITNIGLELANDAGLDIFDSVLYVGFGTGTTSPKVSDTQLQTEVGTRVPSVGTKNDADNEYEFTFRVPISLYNGSSLTEIGLFDAETGGNLYSRSLLSTAFNKTLDDEFIGTLKVKVNTNNN